MRKDYGRFEAPGAERRGVVVQRGKSADVMKLF